MARLKRLQGMDDTIRRGQPFRKQVGVGAGTGAPLVNNATGPALGTSAAAGKGGVISMLVADKESCAEPTESALLSQARGAAAQQGEAQEAP